MNARDSQSTKNPSTTAPTLSRHAVRTLPPAYSPARTAKQPAARWPDASVRSTTSEQESSLVDVDSPDDFPFEGQQANIVPPTGG
ncbi:MAG: hypothetical protein K6T31_09185 [Alicyclobacillus sp.]|nr:hypothetical protein [Alicyclobacillus sp.]